MLKILQPTLLYEERLTTGNKNAKLLPIATHAPVRGATRKRGLSRWSRNYCNPRSCTRSDCSQFAALEKRKDCNPRSCTRSDGSPRLSPRQLLQIATHAPVRGATGVRSMMRFAASIATHAPVRGATARLYEPLGCEEYCNPRSCTRSDIELLEAETWLTAIATHAPVRGATKELTGGFRKLDLLQPTLLYEERRRDCCEDQPGRQDCNPRSCTRSDSAQKGDAIHTQRIATHAPVRGATLPVTVIDAIFEIATHAPVRGATSRGYATS